ncbi:glycosyltransferase involved in cell wall biosynthesis [Nocardioides daedukensis]|uniref:Glycosyltransferase involved in cell wall biosynthesis n=1 Tax=Nocardioides daedukensis TaxID=634462 RepID=A0A7Y9S5S2_9ACTN|nr:glycosyltransferase family A protein [Nocardioides daedukensis]NYG60264.1 glycosyltransferase involved in cell wall biosynthesis [Nocardioides daedukensis]
MNAAPLPVPIDPDLSAERGANGQPDHVVSAVVPTRDRPIMVRRAIESILAQDHPGPIEVIVVFDGTEPDQSLVSTRPGRTVRVLGNARTPGLAGGRNTGILAARGNVIAFCDDDDHWLPGKLRAQLDALDDDPHAEFVTTAMTVDYDGRRTDRLAGCDQVSHQQLISSRMAMLHSSTFVVRRDALVDDIGLVDETLPRSMAEDWDLLLRAARRRPIVHVDRPLVDVTWGATSYFADQWQIRNEARLWLLEHHPEISRDERGAALHFSKLAFGHAALGQRREAMRWSARAFRRNPREPRTVLALLVATRLVRWEFVVRMLNTRGRGI